MGFVKGKCEEHGANIINFSSLFFPPGFLAVLLNVRDDAPFIPTPKTTSFLLISAVGWGTHSSVSHYSCSYLENPVALPPPPPAMRGERTPLNKLVRCLLLLFFFVLSLPPVSPSFPRHFFASWRLIFFSSDKPAFWTRGSRSVWLFSHFLSQGRWRRQFFFAATLLLSPPSFISPLPSFSHDTLVCTHHKGGGMRSVERGGEAEEVGGWM